MDVERTIEFILEMQAKNEERFDKLLAAGEVAGRRLDRLEQTVARLARLGGKSRTRIHHRLEDHEQWFARQQAVLDRLDVTLAEIGDKLNGLIGYVDRWRNKPE